MNRRLDIFSIVVMLVLDTSIGSWQYAKFRHQSGIFYLLSPTYGQYFLAACLILMLAFALRIVWAEQRRQEKKEEEHRGGN